MVIEGFPPSWRKLWNEWEVRWIILFSLTCQIILMLLGNRRRYTKNLLLQITLWSAYFAADSLATFGLGAVSSNLNDALHTGPFDVNLELEAFWTPFFLLHLGGVDTITAYSFEDNELWLRLSLTFVVQTGLVIYVLLLAWSSSLLSILSILILVAGVINYGERTYALWCASYGQRRATSFRSILKKFDETQRHFLETFIQAERLFADFLQDITGSKPSQWCVMNASLNQDKCLTTGVDLIEMGLALMYDRLYTKTKISHFAWGAAMRCICFLLTCVSLLLFGVLNNQEKYSKIDLSITYALLIIAVLKELHGAFVFLTSYTTLVWSRSFAAFKTNVNEPLPKWMSAFLSLRSPCWSNSMGQCSLLDYSLIEEPKGQWRILKLLSLSTEWKKEVKLDETCYVVQVPPDIKEWMFEHYMNYVCSRYADKFENKSYQRLDELNDLDFGGSILAFHIVTEVCYCLDGEHFPDHFPDHVEKDFGGGEETRSLNVPLSSRFSKYISRYMMYLIVKSPEMLQSDWDISQGRFSELVGCCRTICAATMKEGSSIPKKMDETQSKQRKACGNFVKEYILSNDIQSMVLEKSITLLEHLKPGQSEELLEDRWAWISGKWMELLANAAIRCRANQHAQQLSQGGELLTFVRVLIACVGIC